jgi:serine phosphatase RsbU (regulator of sigma subunit)
MLTRINQYNPRLEYFSNELKDETRRLRAEFDTARKIQIMVLPSPEEIRQIDDLDISCVMLPAAEVGGDYYDVIKCGDTVTIGIGDVAGHGLSSGLIMLMAQTAIRTLAEQQVSGTDGMLPVLNRTLLANIRRLKEDRSITLLVITYRNNRYRITGQHESIVLCRHDGSVEVIDTADLGFYLGLVEELPEAVKSRELVLDKGDLLFLYSDGVTEAVNEGQEQFGLERVCATVKKYHRLPADTIKNRFVKDLLVHIGNRPINDDISLVVVKQKQPI